MNKSYLWEKLGFIVQKGFQDNEVFEIMLNPDGNLWFKISKGNIYAGVMNQKDAINFVNALAHYENKFLNEETPYLDAILPFNGERINITIPPITDNISFNIRKKPKKIFTLQDYVAQGSITKYQCIFLENAIMTRKNILISGSPACGKTTFANALLESIAKITPNHRILILEQVPELQCSVKNMKIMLTSDKISMNKLLWIAMRNAPDRIIIGEVRDGAALDMLKAWNTGCPGGIATIHANSAKASIQRVLDLSCEASNNPPKSLLFESLNILLHIEKNSSEGLKTSIFTIKDFTSNEFILEERLCG